MRARVQNPYTSSKRSWKYYSAYKMQTLAENWAEKRKKQTRTQNKNTHTSIQRKRAYQIKMLDSMILQNRESARKTNIKCKNTHEKRKTDVKNPNAHADQVWRLMPYAKLNAKWKKKKRVYLRTSRYHHTIPINENQTFQHDLDRQYIESYQSTSA